MNPFALFKKLLPDAPREIGTVTTIVNSVAVIDLLGGGTVHAYGNTTVGARVFVRDGVIEGPAPSLYMELIEV